MTWSISVLFASLAIGGSIVTTIRAFPHYLMFYSRHLDLGILISLLMAIIFGTLGGDYGLSNLFWDEERKLTQFVAGVSLAVVIVLMLFLGVLCNPRATDDAWVVVVALRRRTLRGRSHWIPKALAGPLGAVPRFWQARRSRIATVRVRRYLVAMFLPLGLALTLPLAFSPFQEGKQPSLQGYSEFWALPLGFWLTFASAIGGLSAASRVMRINGWKRRHGWAAALLVAALVALAAAIPSGITAAMSICLLLGLVALFLFATYRMPLLRVGLLIVTGITLGFTNYRDDKLKIPGMESNYSDPINLSGVKSVEINPNNPFAQIVQASIDIEELRQRAGEPGARDEAEETIEEVCQNVIRAVERIEAARKAVLSARCDLEEARIDDSHEAIMKIDELAGWLGWPSGRLRSTIESLNGGRPEKEDVRSINIVNDYLDHSTYLASRLFFLNSVKTTKFSMLESKLTAFLNLRPDDSNALAGRGHIRSKKGDHDGAIADLDRAHQFRPNDYQYAHFLASALIERASVRINRIEKSASTASRDGPDAIADFDRGIELLDLSKKLEAASPEREEKSENLENLQEKSSGLINDVSTLKSWHASWEARGCKRPKLVVVCASGGGMAAAYWTTLCLTQLNLKDFGFPDRVRLVTGSSGGMLGASYYVAGLKKDEPRGEPELNALRTSLGETDFLTPVVRQLVLGDLWSIFYPGYMKHDRGRELEGQWELATGGGDVSKSPLARTFKELAPGEKEGWRPSLILSPTLVESGRRLLISNLDLYNSGQGTLANSVQLFKLFPSENLSPQGKQDQSPREKVIKALKLSTAVRMNATFPLITPVVPLPFVKPRSRSADAGYLDNYGVELAASWLERHIDWLAKNTGGVALIQLQAYSPELEAELNPTTSREQYLTRIARGWEFLTTPLATYTTARQAAMVYTNRSHVDRLKKLFEEKTRKSQGLSARSGKFEFFESTELRCTAVAPLGWSLTKRDRENLENSLNIQTNKSKIAQLVEFLNQEPPSDDEQGPTKGKEAK